MSSVADCDRRAASQLCVAPRPGMGSVADGSNGGIS
jgi:hypothetical protein